MAKSSRQAELLTDPSPEPRPSRAYTVGWVAAAICAGVCAASILADAYARLRTGSIIFPDWITYATAAHRWLAGEPLFSSAQLHGPYQLPSVVLIGYAYPPPSAVLLAPFSEPLWGLGLFLFVSASLLVTGLTAMIHRELRIPTPWAASAVFLTLALFPAFPGGVVSANVSVALSGLLAWTWIKRASPYWPAVTTAAGVVLKVVPVLLIPWLAVRNRRGALWTVVILLLFTLTTLPVFGWQSWADFISALANARPTCTEPVVSVACVLSGVLSPSLAKFAAGLLALMLAGAATRVPNEFAAFLLGVAAMFAAVTDLWGHTWLLAMVLAVIAIVRVATPRVDTARDRQAARGPDARQVH